MSSISSFFRNLLLTIDQAGNVFLLGSADETISARSYRKGVLENKTHWKAMNWFVNTLFWFEPEHTKQAYEAEQKRCHMPKEYQQNIADCSEEKDPK